MELNDFLGVVQALRANHDRAFNPLALECFLHCAIKPRSMRELEVLTGAHNGNLSRALQSVTPWWSSAREELIMPKLYLLERKKGKNSRAYQFSLSRTGFQLLQGKKAT